MKRILFLTVVLGTVFALSLFSWSVPARFLPNDPSETRQLLGTLFQGLASVLAIVFSIAFLLGQLASGYSPRMLRRAFGPQTLALLLLFLVATMFPVFVWATNPASNNLVRLSILLTGACLLLLVPYFWSLRNQLTPESLLRSIRSGARKRLARSLSSPEFRTDVTFRQEALLGLTTPSEIVEIDDVISRAYAANDYATFALALRVSTGLIFDVTEWINGIPENEQDRVFDLVGGHIEDMIDEYASSARAWLEVVRVLGRQDEIAYARRDWVASYALGRLWYELCIVTARRRSDDEAAYALTNMVTFSQTGRQAAYARYGFGQIRETVTAITGFLSIGSQRGNPYRAFECRINSVIELAASEPNFGLVKMSKAAADALYAAALSYQDIDTPDAARFLQLAKDSLRRIGDLLRTAKQEETARYWLELYGKAAAKS